MKDDTQELTLFDNYDFIEKFFYNLLNSLK